MAGRITLSGSSYGLKLSYVNKHPSLLQQSNEKLYSTDSQIINLCLVKKTLYSKDKRNEERERKVRLVPTIFPFPVSEVGFEPLIIGL
jgi:hypothetical protein